MRWFTQALAPVALVGTLIGCGSKAPPGREKDAPNVQIAPGSGPDPKDVTSLLYPPVAAPVYAPVISRSQPIVISNALAQFEERQIVSAEVDGLIELVATYIKSGEKVDPDRVVYHPRDPEPDPMKRTKLKRLSDGDTVEFGDVVMFIDNQQITTRMQGADTIKKAAETARQFAAEGATAAEKQYRVVEESYKKGGAAFNEVLSAQLTLARFRENEANALQTIAKSTADLADAKVQAEKHYIRSRVNGVIRSVDRRAGQFVKAGEKVMEIEATDRVRIEGQTPVENVDVIRAYLNHPTKRVTVEPAVPSAPTAEHNGHRKEVTGIAVTAHPDGPLVVSVGADGNVLVWDPNLGKKPNRPTVPHNLPHPVAVRSVAATPPTAKTMTVITGGTDGKIRVWDVSNREKLPTAWKAEPEDGHTSAVQAVAVSPDGRFFATAAGRDVFVWDLATAKKLYALAGEHRDNVGGVTFTPQNTLVTSSKDGTLKVWKLGTDKAAVLRTIDHRAGAVEALGASRDGARVLFDQGKTRFDLVDPATGGTTGQIENVSSAGTFAVLALFGPDDVGPGATPESEPYGIATIGGDGDLKGTLQYWHAPRGGGRGAEVGRLVTPGRSPVTAAAFSPFSRFRGEPFVVVGTATGGVYLWKPPTGDRKAHTARVVHIDVTDTRYVTVRVEMDNTQLKLLDHSAATIIVPTNP